MSMQHVVIVGNLGTDPDVRQDDQGAYGRMRVAVTRRWNDAKTKERKEETEWFQVKLWDKHAKNAREYLKKGDAVCVEGRMQTRPYEKDGQQHYVTELVCERMHFLGQRRPSGEQPTGQTAQQPKPAEPKPAPARSDAPETVYRDDIPFA